MRREQFHHTHPITIAKNLSRLLYFLIIPLARGLFVAVSSGSIYRWLQGAYFDIGILLIAVTIAVARWYEQRYHIGENGIYITQGIVRKKSQFIGNSQLATIITRASIFLRPILAVHLIGDTNAGKVGSSDFNIYISKKEADKLFDHRIEHYSSGDYLKKTYRPRSLYITAFSALLSNSLAGVIIAATLFSQASNLVNEEIQNRLLDTLSTFMQFIALYIPPLLSGIALVIIGGFGVAFIQNLLQYMLFTSTRTKDAITINNGLISKRRHLMRVDKINYLDIRQSILSKIFGLNITFVHCTGYGKDSKTSPVLIPAATSFQTKASLRLLLPEFKQQQREVYPKELSRIMAYIWQPLTIMSVTYLSAWILARYFLPTWSELISFIGLMLSIPFIWMLLIKIFDFATTGIGKNKNYYTLYYSSAFYLHTIILPKDKVTHIVIQQHPLQKRSGACDIVVYSFAENHQRHIIKSVPVKEAEAFLKM